VLTPRVRTGSPTASSRATDPVTDSGELSGGRRLRVPVALRWADLDAYSHVNNVEMFRLLEEARIEAFWRHPERPADEAWPTAVLDAGPGAETNTLIAHSEIQYLAPVPYQRAGVVVHLWVGHLGGASIEVCYEVRDTSGGELYARATTTVVLVDPVDGRPRRITPAERAVWQEYRGPPPEFRRRR